MNDRADSNKSSDDPEEVIELTDVIADDSDEEVLELTDRVDEDLNEKEKGLDVTQEQAGPGPESEIGEDRIEAALERLIEKKIGHRIEAVLYEVMERVMAREVEEIKSRLSKDLDEIS
ncbi:MAG: hypothetical protein K9J83_06375 [Desulfarculaceae bacterium]|nr:hypothetical protein [Desulfarculaceae bacterium]